MRFREKIGRVTPTVVAMVFAYLLCSTPVKVVGGQFEAKDSNKKLKNGALVNAFRQISHRPAKCMPIPFSVARQGTREGKNCKKCEKVARWGPTHIQGIAMGENHVIFTSSADGGFIAFGKRNGDGNYIFQRQDVEPYSHPGGIQTIGDWVAVPVEDNDKSEIRFYQYNDKNGFHQKESLTIRRCVELGPAGSVGITNYTSKEGERYLVATIPREKKDGEQEVHFYWTQANKSLSELESPFLGPPKIWKLSEQYEDLQGNWKDYINSMSLVADDAGGIFFVGMSQDRSCEKDYADLYEIDLDVNDSNQKPKFTFIETFEFEIPKPQCFNDLRRSFCSLVGLFKVAPSFRWGGGVLVTSSEAIEVFACAHELLTGNSVAVSIFRAN